uniref:UDP-2,4-diacetamido-2,4, 6-trideoxy-beta-L-altropyranose hydrolase n=1 Tax=Lachnoclostridium phocaeense TaxID=1871021 RepID=UPI0026DC5151|nr:UDP-2,4-diacetamido-2,4,6-trideoxy-beta-L-altropyranose hydrolase [Lachnoclostridium phocaeense]
MVYFRVDGNAEIGTGHIMRCLSIAKTLQNMGETVTFIIADQHCEALIRERDVNTICLGSAWNDLDKEIEQISSFILRNKIECLIIDSCFVTKQYLTELRKITKLIYIDDIDKMLYPVDLLINYNIYAEKLSYPERYRMAGLDTGFAIGCSYVPLRDEFSSIKRTINKSVKRVMITSGGADSYNITDYILRGIQGWTGFSGLEYHVIIGAFNKNREKLLRQWGDRENIYLHYNVSNMAEYMTKCDIAITASGSTTYELCACGTPSIIYTLADNQIEIASAFSEKGLLCYAGDIREDKEYCLFNIKKYLKAYIANYELRKRISRHMQEVIDGNGGKNIIKAMKGVLGNTK